MSKTFRVISWGCGVQSTTLAVMSALGELPKVDAVINADTGWERQATYEARDFYATWLRERGLRVEIISSGQNIRTSMKGKHIHIPFWTANGGPLRRECTGVFKIMPVKRRIRELMGYNKSKPPHPPAGACEMWIGFSLDEWVRIKPNLVKFIENRFPLAERQMTRSDCVALLESHNLPVPPKSACVCCPYRQASAWIEMRDNAPDEWAAAVAFDEEHRHIPYLDQDRGAEDTSLYIYKHGGPLAEADLEADAARERSRDGFQLPLLDASGRQQWREAARE